MNRITQPKQLDLIEPNPFEGMDDKLKNKTPDRVAVAKSLRAYRTVKGVTLKELSGTSGLKVSRLSSYELGNAKMDQVTFN